MLAVSFLLRQTWLSGVRARCRAAAKIWQCRLQRVLDPYRPEFHYMRGPGPRWREKNGIPVRPVKAPSKSSE